LAVLETWPRGGMAQQLPAHPRSSCAEGSISKVIRQVLLDACAAASTWSKRRLTSRSENSWAANALP
jgi:hypothetical protein